jgi:PKD repeat protein
MEHLGEIGEELYFSAYDERNIYDTLLLLVYKPRYRNDRYWDRYIDLYQYTELLSIDSRINLRVKEAARKVMATEDEVIIKSIGGSNHPASSRLFGIYYPTTKNDQDEYSPLVLSTLTAWDEHAALVVEDIDAKPMKVNWTYPNPGNVVFQLSSRTPARINQVSVELRYDGTSTFSKNAIASGGLYSTQIDLSEHSSVEYRYRVEGNYGSFTYPPDGYDMITFQEEVEPPSVWHSSPDAIMNSQTMGGLTFFIEDDSGVEKVEPSGIARLEYRTRGDNSWYSIPMLETGYDPFRGLIEYWVLPTGVPPGSEIEYHMMVSDIYGNQVRYPAEGDLTSKIAEGKRFYLDSYRSNIADHSLLMDRFSAMGMDVKAGTTEIIPDLSSFKGYILVQPQQALSETDVSKILLFHENGGELFVIIDPNDPVQAVNSRWLLERLSMDVTTEGEVEGFYPSDPSSELAEVLPTIGGASSGSLISSEDMEPVYYTSPPFTAIHTGWYGKGRSVFSIPYLLDDDALEMDPNRQLTELIISYLQENMKPKIIVDVEPDGVVLPGQEITIDLSKSYDPDGDLISYSVALDNKFMEGPDMVYTHTFYSTGIFDVLVRVIDAEEGISEVSFPIKVNRPPSTDHGVSSKDPHAGETVVFDYKGNDPDGDEYIVVWDFGDGFKKSGETVSHSYNQRGIYTYIVTIKDSNGLEVNKSGTINIRNSFPVAQIDILSIRVNNGPANFSGASKVTLQVDEGDQIYLSGDLSYDPDRTDEISYYWSMGDGTIIEEIQVLHEYQSSGLFEITLEVDDGFGGRSNISQLVSVANRAPFSSFTYDGDRTKVKFDASPSVDDEWDMAGLIYIWDFGDGKEMETDEPMVTHDYLTGGKYDVKLTVRDSDGDEDIYKITVDVDGLTKFQIFMMIILVLIILGGIGLFLYKRRRDQTVEGDGTYQQEDDQREDGDFSRPSRIRGRRPGNRSLLLDEPTSKGSRGALEMGGHEGHRPFRPPRQP